MDRPLAFRFVALVDRAKTPSAISSALACPCFGDLPSEGSEMRGPEAPRSSHIDGADTKITTQDGGVHAASLTSRGREEGDAKIATATSLSGATNMLEQMRQIWLSGSIMGLIDTSVIGTSSSLELAALGFFFVDSSSFFLLFFLAMVYRSCLWRLPIFVGEKNLALVPAAARYSPLRALLVASVVNGAGDVLLCTFLGYGIASAFFKSQT
ncbi:uncharacterized protein LOC9660786 [Selaginella moellendorffii]|uniref:uncharacterized protein LOC9660786 n=1 Tax=Selaginella moellendorffii TaxID=88036 RepID=UPI000D1D1084|nr:uncharacterized protein LOC9660786 [Selaginella moellendorffii]|eukprot:XP_024545500.1 uncharacterized protein LOC9660786 [Selaginella moellendorffii]